VQMLSLVVIYGTLLSSAHAWSFFGHASGDNFEETRSAVVGSEVFQKKVAQACSGKSGDCPAKAEEALFCQLLQRSKPEMAAEHCAGNRKVSLLEVDVEAEAPPATLAALKAKIMKTAAFHKEAENIANSMGCGGVKKVENCNAYVQEAAFCLAFADKINKFAGLRGAKEETQFCKHIDNKIPELSMLLQTRFQALSFLQVRRAPEDELAKEMTHDLEMNFNKIAPFGKEDTAKELQDHAAKTQDTLVDAVENAEVAEIKRAVFRALTRLRAATIKEFDTIARLETQAIDAYNDAHHYRAENPLTHLHEDEAPVETDKLKSFH